MGVATGCGLKEIYRFPHTTYPYSSCIYLYFFAAASLLFLFIFKMFFIIINGIGNVSRAPIETRNEVDGQSRTRVVTILCQFRAPEKERTRELKRRRRRQQ